MHKREVRSIGATKARPPAAVSPNLLMAAVARSFLILLTFFPTGQVDAVEILWCIILATTAAGAETPTPIEPAGMASDQLLEAER